jgi:tetratricopeptide (TPR) repeat protein
MRVLHPSAVKRHLIIVQAAALILPLLATPALAARREPSPAPATSPAPAGNAADALARGDAAWSRRAEGFKPGGPASAAPIGEAIAAYEAALKAQPERLEIYWKLLRAEHFRGEFAVRSREDKQAVFGHARSVAEAALDRLARQVGGRARLDSMPPAALAKALSGAPEAAEIYLWAGIHWALWGDNFGRLAAARQGVGDRVRRYAEMVNVLDERLESAGGHRLLGRLHTLAPKVPFVTGWVDRGTAVSELRRAVALAPDFALNEVFLADALLQYQPAHAAEARRLLRREAERAPSGAAGAGSAPGGGTRVEDDDAVQQARQLLAKYPG